MLTQGVAYLHIQLKINLAWQQCLALPKPAQSQMIAQTSCRCQNELLQTKIHLWASHTLVLGRCKLINISSSNLKHFNIISKHQMNVSLANNTQRTIENSLFSSHLSESDTNKTTHTIRSHVRSLNLLGAWPTGPMPL